MGRPDDSLETHPIDSAGADAHESREALADTVVASAQLMAPPDVLGDVSDDRLTEEQPGRYRLEGELGEGGIGKVFLAFDNHVGRHVALKELLPGVIGASMPPPSIGGTRSPVELRFVNEARVTGQLEHPGVVPVYELGRRQDGTVYYAMRLVRGRTLGEALGQRDLRGRLELLPHFEDLCNTVAYAHSRGVIHRDLKPENVMLGDFGETVLLDWGLAKVSGQKDVQIRALQTELERLKVAPAIQTVAGVPIGTPGYMSPEQALGEVDHIDERSDVYALGAILYELLTGRPPFDGTTALEVIQKVLSEPPRPPDEIEPDCPPELVAIALRAMNKDHTQRYADARALAADVRAFLAGGLVGAHRYSPTALARRFVRRHRWALLGALAALVVGALAWWYRGVDIEHRAAVERERRRDAVAGEVDAIIGQVDRGEIQEGWIDTYTFALISLRDEVVADRVEDRLIEALAHKSPDVRRLAARALSGMKSSRAVGPLLARLEPEVEDDESVIVDVITALAVIGDARAEPRVREVRWESKQGSYIWRNTELAYRMMPMGELPADPSHMTADDWVSRGRAFMWKGLPDQAIDAFSRAIALDPKDMRAYNNRAIEYKRRGDLAQALADYNRILELMPDHPQSLNNRAALKREMEDYPGAIADLTRVIASGQLGTTALRNRATARRYSGDDEGAQADLERALELEPDNESTHAALGLLAWWRGEHEQAIRHYGTAVELRDDYTYARNMRAELLASLGRVDLARADLDRVLSLDPSDNMGRRGRAVLRMRENDRAGAKQDLEFCLERQCISSAEQRGLRYAQRAAIYFAPLGEHRRALEDIERALVAEVRLGDRIDAHVSGLAIALLAGDDGARERHLSALVPRKPPLIEDRVIEVLKGQRRAEDLAAEVLGPYARCTVALAGGLRAQLDGEDALAKKRYAAAREAHAPFAVHCALADLLARR